MKTQNFKKYSTKQLEDMIERANIAKEILIDRGVYSEEDFEEEDEEGVEKIDYAALANNSKVNIGKTVIFLCTKYTEPIKGEIIGVAYSKKRKSVQYRIRTTVGVFGKVVYSKDLEFVN